MFNVHCSLFNCHLTSVPTRPIQECAQPAAAAGMTQFAQSFGLNLTNTLTGNMELFANFF